MIVRGPQTTEYAVLSNRVLRDRRLSFRARGLLVYLLSMPPGWKTSSDRLTRETTEGRDAIRTAIRELQAAGYMTLTKRQDRRGRWHSEWLCTDCGEPCGQDHSPTPEKPVLGFSGALESTDEEVLMKGVSNMVTEGYLLTPWTID